MNAREKLIDMAENGLISWEALAREALEYMSTDQCEDMAAVPGWLDGEDEED